MNTMVSARVPMELRDQVNEQLKRIGATPTDLINRAYEFVLANKALPDARAGLASGKRTLSPAQRAELAQSIERTTLPLFGGIDASVSYDDLLEDALRTEYASFA